MLHDMLDRASVLDLNDNFEFIIGRGKPLQAEGPEGGLRFPVTARMASKVFEQLRLDVNLVDRDPRPVEEITLRNLLDFAGIPPVTVPAIRPEQQLAEKVARLRARLIGETRSGEIWDAESWIWS